MTFWVAGATIGGALIGGYASNKAAGTQAKAAEQANDTQRQIFERQVELQEPWRQAGVNALTRMQGQTNAMPASFRSSVPSAQGFTASSAANLPDAFTGQVNLQQDPGYAFRMAEGMKALERSAAARGGLLSGTTLKGTQRFAQDLASQEYGNAYNRALMQYDLANQRANQLYGREQYGYTSGLQANNLNYSRALDEYNAAVQREAAGYNRLAALSGTGQTSANTLSSAAGQMGANIAQNQMAAGAARASGYVGGANAITGAVGQYLNYSQGQNYLNMLQNRGNPYVPVVDYSVPYGG